MFNFCRFIRSSPSLPTLSSRSAADVCPPLPPPPLSPPTSTTIVSSGRVESARLDLVTFSESLLLVLGRCSPIYFPYVQSFCFYKIFKRRTQEFLSSTSMDLLSSFKWLWLFKKEVGVTICFLHTKQVASVGKLGGVCLRSERSRSQCRKGRSEVSQRGRGPYDGREPGHEAGRSDPGLTGGVVGSERPPDLPRPRRCRREAPNPGTPEGPSAVAGNPSLNYLSNFSVQRVQ